MIGDAERADIRATAHAMADAAGAAILPFFRRPVATENKAATGYDPVTEADRAAEIAMRRVLAARRPQDGIVGEEYGATAGASGLTWVIDPIDGTRAFLCGAASWGVLIALSDGGGPCYGVIDQPWTGERFEGGFGRAVMTRAGTEHTLDVRRGLVLCDAILATTYPEIGNATEHAGFHALSKRTALTRYGMDCYAYALLALGQIDLVVEAGLQPYDVAAPIAVVQAAGGIVTDWAGGPAHDGGRVIAAGCPVLHAQALEILQGAVRAGR